MKTQLATLLLVFAYHGAAAHNIRGTKFQSAIDRHLKRSDEGKDNAAYRVVGGKKKFTDNKNTISFIEDPAILWLAIDSKDQNKVGKCATAISTWALENYALDLAVVEKEPKDKDLADEDIVVFLEKNTKAEECEALVNEIANSPGFSARKRGNVFDHGQQNIAVFDVDPADKKCESGCSKDKKTCESAANGDADALDACRDDEKECKDDCEEECKDDCDKWWKGLFNEQCRKAC